MIKHIIFKLVLRAIHYSGVGRAFKIFSHSKGIILTGHHIFPDAHFRSMSTFCPNRILELSDGFLCEVIEGLSKRGYQFVSIDEVPALLADRNASPFAALTFDDGYRDVLEHGLPVFEKYDIPITIFLATELVDGNGFLWWKLLEYKISEVEEITVAFGEKEVVLDCRSVRDKYVAWDYCYWQLRPMSTLEQKKWFVDWCELNESDWCMICRESVMNWSEIKELNRHPLVTIGAHTLSHPCLSALSKNDAYIEMRRSGEVLEENLGTFPSSFSYPLGDEKSAGEREYVLAKEAGYEIAVTTVKSLVDYRVDIFCVPRISLNGMYQRMIYVLALESGLPSYINNVAGYFGGCIRRLLNN